MTDPMIPFSAPYQSGRELECLQEALSRGFWQGDGPETARASAMLELMTTSPKALLTTSCTHALEMASMLLGLQRGDEVIVPSFTFSSTASAVAVRGATPVFADVTVDTLNLDPRAVAEALTDRTRAIYVVHYAGVAADVDALMSIADEHNLALVEDNAHGLGARWNGRQLGTFGSLATQSFHATKNVSCGEGGALLINDMSLIEPAEVLREKGTNRARFLRGEVDKYTWVELGSSYLPSDLLSALLVAQLEQFDEIQSKRMAIWTAYLEGIMDWALGAGVELMHVPEGAEHPAHMFYMIMPSHEEQMGVIQHLRLHGVTGTFHYQPLHSSPAGVAFGRSASDCAVTVDRAQRLVRLPLFAGMTQYQVTKVVESVTSYRCRSVANTPFSRG